MIFNFEAGGGGVDEAFAVVHVSYPAGSTLTAIKGTLILKAEDTSGTYNFLIPESGSWIITSTGGGETDSRTVNITAKYQIANVTLAYRMTPDFTYSGSYQLVDDNDSAISASQWANYKGNWRLKMLTSGTLTIRNMYGSLGNVDLFAVGGGGGGAVSGTTFRGGGGGAGGNATTVSRANITAQTYNVVIGSGGASGQDGTVSSIGQYTANGGKAGVQVTGGNGGSGGGAGGWGNNVDGGNGGSNGSNGGGTEFGSGQGTSTREFGASTGKLYAGGGGGGYGQDNSGRRSNPGVGGEGGGANAAENATANTGGGGGGSNLYGTAGSGGSGIIIIRNHR